MGSGVGGEQTYLELHSEFLRGVEDEPVDLVFHELVEAVTQSAGPQI